MFNESIWITGASGRIGTRLKKALKKNTDYKVVATDKEVDITDLSAIETAFDWYKPSIVINCASLSDAKYCEEHKVEAYKVNTLGARNLAIVSMQHNVKLIHLSTDDVFSGENNRAKNEFDIPTPKTVYGKSKLAGENFVRELNPKHLIIRSSWVYGSGSYDYVNYVLEHAKNGEAFEASVNRISSPTYDRRIADFILKMIPEKEYGIYHASSEGICTRHQMATFVLEKMGYDPALAIPTTDMKKTETAVVSTLLENLMIHMTDIYTMPEWQTDLEKYLNKLKKEA